MAKRQIRMVPLGDPQVFRDAVQLADPQASLRELLSQSPALSLEPLEEADLERPLAAFLPMPVRASPETPLYRPPGLELLPQRSSAREEGIEDHSSKEERVEVIVPQLDFSRGEDEPEGTAGASLRDVDAVRLAYGEGISSVASFLRAGLSVLVRCDKLVVEHLWRRMALEAGLTPVLPSALEAEDEMDPTALEGLPGSSRRAQVEALKTRIHDLKTGDVLVLPHLDLLAGGERRLNSEARELIDLLYGAADRLLLAFADRSLEIPEVLAARFAVRRELAGVPRIARLGDGGEALLGDVLTTSAERAAFTGFDAAGLYKNVAGLNPVRLRQAITYAVREEASAGQVPVERLYRAIRAFKAQTSSHFEIPETTFDDIGGYGEVKRELGRALELMLSSFELPDPSLQRELIPRGFIFHGPPGTGKTLFAKAVANQLNGTIQVVSGPEITDMYLGESERKVRELFAEARRNAPAVLVFDEFDAIAGERTGRDDGGSRAGNAIVAQILTEMDGFREDVPLLVVGTTNRLDIIDAALLRPSRFRALAIGLPDRAARRAIAEVHARHFHVPVKDEAYERVAEASEGWNGDEIRALFRDACVALFCEKPPRTIDAEYLEQLIERVEAARH